MNKRIVNLSILLTAVIFLGLASLFAQDPNNRKRFPLRKIAGEPLSTLSNVNNISFWVQADGTSGRNPLDESKPGAVFPRGTARIFFADGILWGGLVNDLIEPRLRVGGSMYFSGNVEGAILGERTGIAEDPASTDVRIWRIRDDWATADLLQDAAEFFDLDISTVSEDQIEEVRAQYRTDWDEWPAAKGAPYYDDNSDGIYDPTIDRPGIANADQVVWFVANDIDSLITAQFFGSPPIGIEHQVTIWGYANEGIIGNIIFRRNRLIYKGTKTTPVDATIDSMYISQWSDVELGDFGDDWAGFDTLLNTAYVYNITEIDDQFIKFGLAPPSVGYTLIQGPSVPSAGDKAILDFGVRSNFKNLPLSSFIVKMIGTSISDPFSSGN